LTVALAATAFAGCSSAPSHSGELRAPGQAAGFVAELAWGEPSSGWQLASHASQQAVEAWKDRDAMGDLGRRLRSEDASWACELAQKLVSLGAVGAITSFDENDVSIVTNEALKAGAKPDRISATIHDASTVPFRDLALVTVTICGPRVS
jgi:hypothetical protein